MEDVRKDSFQKTQFAANRIEWTRNLAHLEEMIVAEDEQIDRWRHCLVMMNEGLWTRVRRRDVLVEWKQIVEAMMSIDEMY